VARNAVKIQKNKETVKIGDKVYEYSAFYLRIPSSIAHLFGLEKGMKARISVKVNDNKLRLIYEIDLARKKNTPGQEE
jgi:hypothetical protein